MVMKQKGLIWLRRDLRIHDQEILQRAQEQNQALAAIYFLRDPNTDIQKKFLYETLLDLQKKLALKGISLTIIPSPPSERKPSQIKEVCLRNKISHIWVTQEYSINEKMEEQWFVTQCDPSLQIHFVDQRTLIKMGDLPFSVSDLPETFTAFRKAVEQDWRIRNIIQSETLNGYETYELDLNNCEVIDLIERQKNLKTLKFVFKEGDRFQGGEDSGLRRLQEFIWDSQSILHYKETRNQMLALNDSSKFSPWLANGSLSARRIYWEIKSFEQKFGANSSTYWLVFELLWRDFFKFLSLKLGPRFYHKNGISKNLSEFKNEADTFQKWCRGQTDSDFVNANMNELNETGWMSNRGRQNVASYLAKTLKINWLWGAQYFEDHLIDEDPESNWGNWQYLAGVGADPRDRIFNVDKQAEIYDPDFSYRKKWLKMSKTDKANK